MNKPDLLQIWHEFGAWVILFVFQIAGFAIMANLLSSPHEPQLKIDEHPVYAPLYHKITDAANAAYWVGIEKNITSQLSSPVVLKGAFEDLIRHEVKSFLAPYRKGYVPPVWQTVSAKEQQQAYDLFHERIVQNAAAGGWRPEEVAELGQYAEKLDPTRRRELIELYLKNQPLDPEAAQAGGPLLPPPL